MEKFEEVSLYLSQVCDDNGLTFKEIKRRGKIYQLNISRQNDMIMFYPTTNHYRTNDSSGKKIYLDFLIPSINHKFGTSIKYYSLSSLVKEKDWTKEIPQTLKNRIIPITMPSGKIRYFLKDYDQFNNFYKNGFTTKENLVKAYNWYTYSKKIRHKAPAQFTKGFK